MAERDTNTTHTGMEKESQKVDESQDSVARPGPGLSDGEKSKDAVSYPECVVCLQNYHHPVKLPCGHVFCFLCVKGVAARSRRCALCRAEVPMDYFDKPVVVDMNVKESSKFTDVTTNKTKDSAIYKWYYEGRNGWWQYEERASVQLEDAFSNGDQSTELVIAGFVYIVDIKDMVQYRKNYPTRRRRVKRDKASADKKGVAGLKSSGNQCPPTTEATSSAESVGKTAGELERDQRRRGTDDEVDLVTEKLEKTL